MSARQGQHIVDFQAQQHTAVSANTAAPLEALHAGELRLGSVSVNAWMLL
jgi:hypothetical protein